jgi:hypothetical protein
MAPPYCEVVTLQEDTDDRSTELLNQRVAAVISEAAAEGKRQTLRDIRLTMTSVTGNDNAIRRQIVALLWFEVSGWGATAG